MQRRLVGSVPLQLALALASTNAHANADAVGHQVSEQGMNGEEFLELPKD